MKLGKKFISLALALVMVFSLTVSANAAAPETVTVQLSPNITVKLNGEIQTMTDVNGNPVYPVLYGGTTYLPIRAVGNMLGLNVDWDGDTQTVILEKSDGKTSPAKTDGKAPADAKPTEITVQINPNITVKYNGEAQAMTDVNGNPVYPMLYGGTTYLPVRAVSNMLGVKVEWDGDTQTVLLDFSENSGKENNTNTSDPGENNTGTTGPDEIAIGTTDPDAIKTVLAFVGLNDTDDIDVDEISKALMENGVYMMPNGITIRYGEADKFNKLQTSADAKVLGEKHIGYDFAEIDWTHANDGYVSVKLNEKLVERTRCYITWLGSNKMETFIGFTLPLGKWVNLPLTAGSREYVVDVQPEVSNSETDLLNDPTNERWDIIERSHLTARFAAEITNPNALWLMPHIDLDFENAPKTCAKAQEITKDCKTDAEKITAVFNYVSTAIKYDHKEAEERKAYAISQNNGTCKDDPLNNKYTFKTPLDDILENKTGVCEHYARLMAGMLRSLGIPCKVCSGNVYTGEIVKGYSDDGWMPHAWVAVKPETGTLDMNALGAGKDFKPAELGEVLNSVPTGWIRLDPTWGNNSSDRAAAAIDENHITSECY